MKLDCKEYENKMKKSIAAYETALADIRAGRANPGLLDKITVDYYGSPTKLTDMATVKVSDARTLVISPYDASTLKNMEKAILASSLGITPQNDGKVIRLTFPQLTEERRKELTKQVSKMGDEAKVAIRNIRREANDAVKEQKKNGEMTEDEAKVSDKEIQDLTDRYIKKIEAVVDAKDKEMMTI
ncbi:MAG: ribosome recycling factor [Eubacteriales bacterium]|nr:ribosome recycling factor [Eubacteriales bacterium]